MKIKSPTEPIVLSKRDASWLQDMLKSNERRTVLTDFEKDLLEGSKCFDGMVKSFIDD